MRRAVLFATALLAVTAAPADAFDGRREGFVLGLGGGFGHIGAGPGFYGVATHLDIGLGLDDRTLVHYAGKQVIHASDGRLFTQAFPLLGVTHYLREEAPGPFLTGGLGGAFNIAFDHGEVGVNGGVTVFGGGGWEFARHWNVELDVTHTTQNSVGVTSVLATVGCLAY